MPHRRVISTAAALALALTALTSASPAWCTEPLDGARHDVTAHDTDGGYAYDFHEDDLSARGFDAHDVAIRAVRHAQRDVLIRPRLSFVPELLKTVENM